jgi:hypothetical protein
VSRWRRAARGAFLAGLALTSALATTEIVLRLLRYRSPLLQSSASSARRSPYSRAHREQVTAWIDEAVRTTLALDTVVRDAGSRLVVVVMPDVVQVVDLLPAFRSAATPPRLYRRLDPHRQRRGSRSDPRGAGTRRAGGSGAALAVPRRPRSHRGMCLERRGPSCGSIRP